MNIMLAGFDIILIASLLWLAWNILATDDIFKAVVLFISFSLLMALCWVRLHAPDVAMAEAAIGAGLTGPLFLAALRRMKRIHKSERRMDLEEKRPDQQQTAGPASGRFNPVLLMLILLLACLTGLLAVVSGILPVQTEGLGNLVADHLPRSGVTSPVTAVLLNFRGYDTLLEIMVLLVAVIGVWSLNPAPMPRQTMDTSPVQVSLVRLLAPVMTLVAFYLVWQGAARVGGAFQGGAVLGGAGVLLLVTNFTWLHAIPSRPLRLGLTLGPTVFLGIAVWCMISNGTLLAYPESSAGSLILVIETACALSIGISLTALFAGGRPNDSLSE